MARTAILGGTFDPPHVAHVEMAQTAAVMMGFDQVLLTPAYEPPHKHGADVSPFEIRLEMTMLAAAGYKNIGVSTVEKRRGGCSFTVDLLRDFRESSNDDLYFILGADSLRDFPTWKDPKEILRLATIVVFPRGGQSLRLEIEGEANLVVFEKPVIDVSSHDIRKRYRAGAPVESLVPEKVHKYILDKSLFCL